MSRGAPVSEQGMMPVLAACAGDEAYAVLRYAATHTDMDGPGLTEVRLWVIQ